MKRIAPITIIKFFVFAFVSNISVFNSHGQANTAVASLFWRQVRINWQYNTLNSGTHAYLYNMSEKMGGSYSDIMARLETLDRSNSLQDLIALNLYVGFGSEKQYLKAVLNNMCKSASLSNSMSDFICKKYSTDKRALKMIHDSEVARKQKQQKEAEQKYSDSLINAEKQKTIIAEKQKAITATANVTEDEKQKMLDALRPPIEHDLKQPVKFVGKEIQKCDNWALAITWPKQANGAAIDYSKTQYWQYYGDGGGGPITALLKEENGSWRVAEYELGPARFSLPAWITKYNLEDCMAAFGVTK